MTQFANPKVKILTAKHFAFGNQSGDNQIWEEVENIHMMGIPILN